MYNNYNPYFGSYNPNTSIYQPQITPQIQPQMQPQITQYKPQGLLGKAVDSLDVVKATDIPLDR